MMSDLHRLGEAVALFDLIAGSIVAGAVEPGDLMLTTKLFAGLVAMLAPLVFVAIALVQGK